MPKSKNSKPKNDKGSEGGSKVGAVGGQSANIRHILCAKQSKKDEALKQLQEGQPFNTVALAFSEDKGRQGGLLGWKLRADLIPEFAEAAFKLTPSKVGSPVLGQVHTSEGYHIIMVEGFK